MNNLQIFKNTEFGEIRTVLIDGEPWFVGKDIAEILGYGNTKDALATHVDTEDKTIIQRSDFPTLDIPNRGMTVINESGLYSLTLSSKLPQAKPFKRWVTSEVLPSIRKTGLYKVQGDRINLKEQVESLQVVADMLRMNDASKILMLEGFYKGYNIPTDFLPKYEHNGSRQLRSATALLKENDCGISTLKFNQLLLDGGYLEEKERPSSSGTIKKFKSLTEKGLQYEENAVSPHNQRETQPLYYEDSFMDLTEQISRMGV